MNVLLILLCMLIFIMTVYGYETGFIKMSVPILSGLLSLFVLLALHEPLLAILFQWTFLQGEYVLARVIVILLLYLLITLAFKWIIKVLNLLTKLPLMHGMNKLMGMAIGAIEGFLLVWLFLYIVEIRQGFLFGVDILSLVMENICLQFLYENNLVAHLMNTLFGSWIA